MKNLLERINERLRGALPRRAIASLLVAAECFSVVAVGVPVTYAEDEGIVAVSDQAEEYAYPEEWSPEDAIEDLELWTDSEETAEDAVSPAEAAELGAQAAEQAAYEAELAAYDAAMAAYDAETSLEDLSAAEDAAARADEAARRAEEAAKRAADEADWTLEAYFLADQEAQKAAEEASAAEAAASDAARELEALVSELEKKDDKQDQDEKNEKKTGEKTVKATESTVKPSAKPEKETPDRNLKSSEDKSAKPADRSTVQADENKNKENGEDAEDADKKAEIESAREKAETLAAEADEKAALAAYANEEAERAWAAADRAAEAANRAAAAVESANEANARAAEAAQRAAAYQAEREQEALGIVEVTDDAIETADGDKTGTGTEAETGTETGTGTGNGTEDEDEVEIVTGGSISDEERYGALDRADAMVTVAGELPEGVEIETLDVAEDYQNFNPDAFRRFVVSDLETFASDGTGSGRSERREYAVLAAYDITLTLDGEEYQPGEGSPLAVSIAVPGIPEGKELQVWHILDDGSAEQIVDFTVADGAVSFAVPGFSVYVVVCTTLEQTLTASDGNEYLVTVTYDNTSGIPSDAELSVSEIKEGEAGYEEYVAQSAAALGEKPDNLAFARPFDITLKNAETGEEYQPNKDVKVTIELLKDSLDNYENIDVVHIPDGVGEHAQVMDTAVHGESVEFETDGFSVYVLIGSGGETVTPQCTYTFYVPDPDSPGQYKEYSFKDSQGHTVYNQTISSGEELIVPQITSADEKTFAGWYKGDTTGGTLTLEEEPYNFDNITITENSAIDLYAVYKKYATVIFHDKYDSDSDSFPVAYTRRAELLTTGEGDEAVTDASVKIDDLNIANTRVNGKEMAFFGWSKTPITTPGAAKDDEGNNVAAVVSDAEGCIQVTGAQDLYPIFIETFLLTFYAAESGQGAAYNGPQYVNKGDYLNELPTTSLNGYTFTGWFTGNKKEGVSNPKPGEDVDYGTQISNANGTLILGVDDAGVYVSDGKLYLRADTTLYAGWTGDTSAEYRILYWQQNGIGSDYTYVESKTCTGTVGETVSVSVEDKANDRYTGFHLKEEPASAEIKADGSTVLNVYYDHDDGYEPAQGTYNLTFADSVTEEGKVSPNLNPAQTKSVEAGTILAGQAIENPASGRRGYIFSKWFLDPYGNKEATLDSLAMPDHDLTLYAGWEVEWYVVSIDPNYGELRPLNDQGVPTGTGSTWFWQNIEREPIAEYTYVERNYVASSSGTFYYVFHPGDGKGGTVWPDRYTYYTTDISKATEDTSFEYSPGTYTYAGWYEVLDDGTEVPYTFGERTDHNTNLKLHWKKNGVYYLKYNAVVGSLSGTMDDVDASAELFADGIFADHAEITLTHSAIAPNGYTFVGWKVRGSDSSVIYTPGQIFTLHADDAKRISGKDVVYLDAVYARVGTASIIYDANGGTVAENSVDFGKVPGSTVDEWNNASGTIDTVTGTATVSGLANNSKFKLSDGTGFTAPAGSGATFLGWSDKAVCDDSATFYSTDDRIIYGVSETTALYSVWGAQVTYNLNSTDAGWGDEAWDTAVYTLSEGVYSQTANLGTVVSEPTNVPVYTGADGKLFRYWATRTGSGTEESPYVFTEYDFTQPITGALDLYAYWGDANTITVHAVDASGATLVDKTSEDGWTVTNITVSATETALNGTSHVTATPENYEFAFVAVASDLNSVSESNAVTAIKYENKKVLVRYKDETLFRVLGEGRELYFVYYEKKALRIGYKSMAASGVLENVTTQEAPTTTDVLLGEYSMSSQLTEPLSLVTGFTNYAFAVGSTDPGSGTQMNASNLRLITDAVGAGDPIPTLRVRNTWRGFEYTMETGENAVWTSCGYTPQLYVVYYTQQPTVVMFEEKTVGTSAVMDTAFTYSLLVTETTTITTSVQTQTKDGDNWVDSGDPVVTETTSTPETIFDTTAEGNQPYILKNGEANSSILFYSSSVQIGEPVKVDENTQTVSTTTTVTAQTAVITQTLMDTFTTSINVDGSAYAESQNVYTYTATGSGGTKNVTFTNTHKSLPVEVHVAMVEGDGASSGIVQRDGTYRNTTETAYKFNLTLGESVKLLEKLPAVAYETTEGEGSEAHQVSHEGLFVGDSDSYAFGSVAWGTGTEGNSVAVNNMGAVSIAYAQTNDNVYELVLKDGDGNTIGELGSNQVYYLYYPMPKIRYVKEATDGTLTDITGCLTSQTTGNIEASDSVTYSHQEITMNGKTVARNQSFEIPLSGFVISQSGNNFRMPPVLDDGLYERYLGYVKIGAGSGTASNSSDLDVSTGLTMQLKVQNNTLQYSFDGTNWKNLPLSGTPTVYAIYSERGYDLQISKTVDMSQSGEDPLFSGASFPVTISSMAITRNRYDVEGADSSTVTATPAEGTTSGTITLTVVDGTKVRIKGLGRGDYTITESGNENYTFTARTGSIVGSSTTPMTVADNTTVSFTLGSEKKVDLTNSPKAICKIDDHYFYTLRSMVDYVDENIATKTATAEMLTDYLMPLADTVEIPSDFNITLTTIEDPDVMDHPAVISRTADLAAVPLFSSAGNLTFTNLTLEGSSIEATAPMIQSAGNLTIGSGATIQNCVGSGAINATAGNITVSGTIQSCSAPEGGAIYHSGNGTITLNGTGAIQDNTATSGNGGAIWLAGGMVKVSGTSKITGNKAESSNGGAIYANSIVEIEVDQGGAITANTAKEGGAIYANATATISISETENVTVKPAVTGNTATTGNGGAIYVNGGSISVSGGSVSSNKAENGQGGAIYSSTASVTVSGTAEVKNNTAKEGGAVHSVSGAVTVSETTNTTTTTDDEGNETTTVTVLSPAISGNTASTGNGGAIYVGSGNVTVSGGSMTQNNATAGSGGAIYANSGSVTVSGGSMSKNTAKNDGGAVFAGSGSITVSASNSGTAPTIQGNKAESGKGGALYTNSGAVSITGTALTQNAAGTDGGAVYAGSGAVTLTNSTFGGDAAGDGNTSGGSGGAVYAGSSNVTVSGGSMKNNKSTGGDGGAFYAGSGTVTVSGYTVNENTSYTQFVSNSATAGKGGAVYLDSGSLTLTSVTAEGNSAINGAAIFTNTGRASFGDGSCSGNVASSGGAVGVGSTDARLVFTGNVQIKNNKLGTGDDAPKSNVYLNQDDDAVVNIDTLGGSAAIGIYVPDAVVPTRSVPGARFAVYTSNSNVAKITNDRYPLLTVQSDTSAKKLYWGNSIKVSVHTLDSYGPDFTQTESGGEGTQLKKYDAYYPESSDAAISELASELVVKDKLNIGTKVYAGAYLDGSRSFGDYITRLTWNKDDSNWYVTTRSGDQVCLTKAGGNHRIYIYYAEPAYLSIENNTDMALTISEMKIANTSVINSETVAGYGMVYAKNGAIRSALLPVAASDLNLAAGGSINLLIPGGQGRAYTLTGSFNGTKAVRLRRTSMSEESLSVTANVPFTPLTGTTLSTSSTYQIIFGNDKNICKVVDAGGVEHPYSKISDAINAIKGGTITLEKEKTATIEMLTDYLLPTSDHVLIPRGYDITLTTAKPAGTEGVTYPYLGASSDGRAVISRDTENKYSMIDAWNSAWNYSTGKGTDGVTALDGTTLTISKLVLDGKSVRGESDGGAVASKYVNVYVDNVDFKNVYASNGGAMLIMFSAKDKNNKATVPGTVFEVRNSDFTGCTSWTTEKSNRLGGGAIVSNAERMTLENCSFTNCTAVDQAGAVFHRVDGNYNSWTNVTGCTFTNCSANAAGGLELDSKTIMVKNTTFEHCVAKERNGGGFNVWPLNSGDPTSDCWVTVIGSTFNDCQLTGTNGGNGGGFRSAAVYTKVINSTFSNNQALYGGGFCISTVKANKAEVYGCTFERNTANQGGGIFGKPKELIIGDGYYYLDSNNKTVIVLLQEDGSYKDLNDNPVTGKTILPCHTQIKNCTSQNEGGGIYQNREDNGSSLTITNATISGNVIKNNSKSGGGIFTVARKVIIDGSSITDNTCTGVGGGMYVYASGEYSKSSDTEFHKKIRMVVKDSTISRNTASGNGGGVWFDANSDDNRAKQVLTINGSSIERNASGGSGGGIYTWAKTVDIGASETRTDDKDKAIRSSISNNTAKTNGGGIYQNRNVDGSSLTIADTNINGNTSNNASNNTDAGGGGIFAGVRTLTITDSDISNNTSKIHGGGVLFEINNDTARDAMSLTVEGCTLNGNTASGNGGGIYTRAKTVEIKAHTEGTGESEVVTKSEISNCTAAWSGGGIYQNRDVDGSTLTVTGSVISGCRSNDTSTDNNPPRGGGGIMANVITVTVTGSEIKNNTAVRNGGGIDAPSNATTHNLVIDNSKITGNTAGNQGGGIFTRSQLTLRKGTEITGNRLTTNTAANCAGVYLPNERTLFVGHEDAGEGQSDTIIVRNNTTANGTLSDLRLWDNGSENNAASVYVYCNLSNNSEIRVVNAAKAGTQFGSAKLPLTNGFSDDNPVFKADSSTLYGITDRTDPTNKTIIWAGPPIAKLTDGNGRLLYLKYYGGTATYPAIFDRLDTGNNSEGSTASPFSLLRMENLTLYYKDGTEYNGTDFCIKMLVEHYETSADMTLPYVEGRTVTFTTAEKNFPNDWPYDDLDTYHFEGRSGGRATVIRGKLVPGSRTLMNVNGTLNLENIVIDGGTENGVTVTNSTRCMYIGYDNNIGSVILGENAVLQNGKVRSGNNGGGVLLNDGTLNINGGIIRNCTAGNDGGGVFLQSGSVTLAAGSIYQCSASTGGGVRTKNGTFTMTGGTIQGCSSTSTSSGGGGVCIAGGQSMYMSGGSIINNSAQKTGGGIMVYSNASRLYFSGKVNISGNTSEASKATNKACNVELNQDFNGVINTTGDGLYPGAYIGVYVPDGTTLYDKHGVERKPFGNFKIQNSQTNTTNFYSFVNDRNGLKGGIIEKTDPNYVKTGDYADCCIYWIKIFSLEVTKEVVSGSSTTVDPDELFLFKVNVRGNATVAGQLNAAQIDSRTGDYGEMQFTSNGSETTTAVFGLVDGQTISGVNLSEGLTYEVTEYLTVDQAKRYAAMPMNGAGTTTESLEYNGVTYQVIRANSFASTIGENKTRTDVDPYTSALTFSNLMPVCKITDMSGNLLYRRYNWEKVTNKTEEGQDGGNSTNQPNYYAPAVYTELTGDDGAFKALEGTLYSSNGSNPTSYSVSNGVQIQMLIGDYRLNETITASTSKVTLTTASSEDTLFPKQDAGTTSTIRRAFAGGSMFSVSGDLTRGDLTLATVILDGVKGSYAVAANGGIISVENGGNLTIQDGATLQSSRTAEGYSGGAVYVASGGAVTMTGGTVNHNESVGNGAGIYLAEGSTLNLSGAPNFGGTGTNISGNITITNGNFKTETMTAKLNGGKNYTRARQDIYLAGTGNPLGSIQVTGAISSGDGTIWVWAGDGAKDAANHYYMLKQFAVLADNLTVSDDTRHAFRNARPDADTDCGGEYLTGQSGDRINGKNCIYWTGGFDFSFLKIDGFGNPLAGAEFTLYTEYSDQNKTPYQKAGVTVSATSSDGTAGYPDPNNAGSNLPEGTVFFSKIAPKTYYMAETQNPTGFATNTTVYQLVIESDGTANLKTADTEGTYTVEAYKVNKGTETDPEYQYRIMNESALTRKVILRKTGKTYAPLSGATFEILRADRSPVKSRDAGGAETTSFTSGSSGVYFIDSLPYGVYYLKETALNGTTLDSPKWFYLIVDETGVFEKESQAGGYDSESAVEAAAKSKIQTILAARTGSGA